MTVVPLRFLPRPHALQPIPDYSSAQTAEDVAELGDVIPLRYSRIYLTAEVDEQDKHQRERYPSILHSGKRGHDDQHKHNAAGTQNRYAREEYHLNDAGDESGDDDEQ